jgi:adenylate cyclase
VKYVKVDEVSGKEKKVSEPYLVDAMSFTEAEARIHKELEQMISGEFNVTNISKSNITELYPNENGDRWFKAKVSFIDVDENSGKEKKANQYMLTQANNVKQAYEYLEESLSTMIVPYEIPSVTESPIMDVFPYFSEEGEEIPDNLKPVSELEPNENEFE